ncbi:hypothetical protein FJTKL_04078 [Diaporthe vaccinii]|uniref:Uncharacterized protein n=1 Tax=Diaporthe vaccinii TaxID=105482 RepID=A0ABR4DUS6_9PEZI
MQTRKSCRPNLLRITHLEAPAFEMVKQRYLVVIVRPASEVTYVSPGRRASLLVPFSPEAIISTFIDELWRRLARHDGAIPLTAETHNVSLHLEHENGPVIDVEDLLSDVITDTQKEKIFAVFSRKRNNAPQLQSPRVHIKSCGPNLHPDERLRGGQPLFPHHYPIDDKKSRLMSNTETTDVRHCPPVASQHRERHQLHISTSRDCGNLRVQLYFG